MSAAAPAPRPNLKDFSPGALRERFAADGFPAFRADQVAQWLYARGVEDPSAWTDLPHALREGLAARFETRALEVTSVARSSDGTLKATLAARDGAVLEAVVIPEEERTTLCVSTQVGCPVGCRFCASGIAGVVRNLRASEIVEQFLHGRAEAAAGPLGHLSRAVIMGIGEPLLNADNLLEALALVTDPEGLGLGTRRVTISTIGHPDRIRALAARGRPYPLAVSLHAPDDETRARLVPSMAKIPIADILAAARDYFESTGREVTFEYVLLGGVNDAPEHAQALARLLAGTRSTVNLIPWNRVAEFDFDPPAPGAPERFASVLRAAGIPATIRWSRGADAAAACGQLRIDRARK